MKQYIKTQKQIGKTGRRRNTASLMLVLVMILHTAVLWGQITDAIPAAPNPPRLVNDFTGSFLTHDQADALEKKLVAYDDSTSNQIAVVIVDELKGYSRDEFAIALGRKWGVGGQKQFSNGVVILVNTGTKGDQRGVFIATGYGLEGAITDLVADQIVQHSLIPNFKQGNNYRGLDLATSDIMDAAAGKYKAPADYRKARGGGVSGLLIVIIVIVIIIIISRKGGGGGYISRRGARDSWGGPVIFPGNWGGDGGGWSGGGGGGFGGFGGGGFGGGGAGGSW